MTTKRDATPFYREILADAWHLTFSHKHLWVFGFFATFIGFGGVSEVLFGVYDRSRMLAPVARELGTMPWMLMPGFATMRAIVSLSPYPAVSIGIFTLVFVFFFALIAWVVSTAIGSLIGNVRKIERGGHPKFSDGLKIGSRSVGRVFVINLATKVIIALTLLLTSANLVHLLSDRSYVSAFIYLLSYLLFTVLAVVVTLIGIYATNSTVINEMPIIPSVADGLRILKRNWLINIEMVLVLLFVNAGIAFVALLLAMVLSVPLIFLFVLAAIAQSTVLMTVIMSVTAIVLVTLIILMASIMTTFQSAAWTLCWVRLSDARHPYLAKLLRTFKWLRGNK